MNHPTREEFERLEEEHRQLREEVRQLKQQQTEPMPVTRVEVVTPEILQQHQQELKQMLQQNYDAIMEGMLKTVRDENNTHFEQIEKTLATRKDVEDLLIKYLQPKPNGHKGEEHRS
jgi:F0F1-type ATP synthase alpha subunit